MAMKDRTVYDNYSSMKRGGVESPRLARAPITRVYSLKEQILEQSKLLSEDPNHEVELKLYESENAVQVLKQRTVADSVILGEAQRQFTKSHSKKIAKSVFDVCVRGVFQSVQDKNGLNKLFDQQHSLTGLLDNVDGNKDFTVPFAVTVLKDNSKVSATDICAFGYDCVNNKSKKSNPVENFYIGLNSGNPKCIKIYEHLDNLELDVMENNYKVFPESPNRFSLEGFALFQGVYDGKNLAPWVRYMKKSVGILRTSYSNSAYAKVNPTKAKILNIYDMKGVSYLLYRVSTLADTINFDQEHLQYAIESYWNRHTEMLHLDGEKMNRLNTPKVSGLWEESVAYNYVLRAYNRFAIEKSVPLLDLKQLFPNVWQVYHPAG
jgi:hypothetical protein